MKLPLAERRKLKADIKTKMRQMLLKGHQRSEIWDSCHEDCKEFVTRDAIKQWWKELRKAMSLSETKNKGRADTNRGLALQRAEYLYHISVNPPEGEKLDRKTAVAALKLFVTLAELDKPAVTSHRETTNNFFGDVPMNVRNLSTEQLKRIQAGETLPATVTAEDAEIIDAEVQP